MVGPGSGPPRWFAAELPDSRAGIEDDPVPRRGFDLDTERTPTGEQFREGTESRSLSGGKASAPTRDDGRHGPYAGGVLGFARRSKMTRNPVHCASSTMEERRMGRLRSARVRRMLSSSDSVVLERLTSAFSRST
jgi:hypothetical protein